MSPVLDPVGQADPATLLECEWPCVAKVPIPPSSTQLPVVVANVLVLPRVQPADRAPCQFPSQEFGFPPPPMAQLGVVKESQASK